MLRRLFKNKAALPTLLGLVALLLAAPHYAHANVFDLFGTVTDMVTKIYSYTLELIVLPLAAGVLYLVGYIFDSAVYFSLHTAYIFGLSTAINLGWVIVRDVMNIFFIFILIYISLGTIVNGLRFGTMTMLKNVVIAALLINFSLFITKAVIDVSNIFGNWLYGGVQKTLIASSNGTVDSHVSLSGLIVGRLHIVEYWKPSALPNTALGDINSQNIVTTFVRLAIVLAATYIFMYASVIFITRAITLLFLLVFSPVGFMGEVLPQIGEYSKEWRSELTTAAMFPIVFMLMLYIALQFINGIDTVAAAVGQSSSLAIGNSIGGTKFGFDIGTIFNYFLIIFLLHATLKVSKKYSGELGTKANGMAESLGKLAIGASTGVAGFAGRRLLGAAASNWSGNASINDAAAGKIGSNAFTRFGYQVAGKAALATTKGLAKSSFDVRGVDTLGNIAGVNVGNAGGKDGYKGMVKEREDKEKKYAEGFGDSPEGIERRMAYAENRRRSILTRAVVGNKAASKIGDKIRGDAGSAFTKSQTETAKSQTQEIKNQIVAESMAVETLKRANQLESAGAIDKVIDEEKLRLDQMIENARKNPKNALLYNRYNRNIAEERRNNPVFTKEPRAVKELEDEIKRLDEEFKEKTATMLDEEKVALLDKKNKKVKEIADLENYVINYKTRLDDAKERENIVEKKTELAETQDFIKTERLDELARKLAAKKSELEAARKEQNDIEGGGAPPAAPEEKKP